MIFPPPTVRIEPKTVGKKKPPCPCGGSLEKITGGYCPVQQVGAACLAHLQPDPFWSTKAVTVERDETGAGVSWR